MFIDSQLQFSDAQAITADATGTNVVDLSVSRAIGVGEPMAVLFTVDVAASQTNSDEDYEFEVEYASDAAQTTARQQIGSLLFESGTPGAPALNADLLVAGFQFAISIPHIKSGVQNRYLGIRYDVTGTDPTVTVTASVMPLSMIQGEVVYAKNYNIQ